VAETVLIVDDERGSRDLLRRWLVGWGYGAMTAANATEALEAMLREAPQIMLVDIKMSGHDGFWLIERVRGKWPRTAIVIASDVVEIDALLRAQQLGAVDFVTKPFGRELLHEALDRAAATLVAVVREGPCLP
jgi:CheY-like chemotaxis protein